MAALTQDRKTDRRDNNQMSLGAAAGVKCYTGGIVVRNATGYAAPGSTALNLKALGIAEKTIDNSSGNDGDLQVPIRKGTFKFENSAGADEITNAEIGTTCYIVDDQTVAKTDGTGTRSEAGAVVQVDSSGVWVTLG